MKESRSQHAVVPIERIAQRILLIRRKKVLIDADLADFYGVATKRLNEQVKRNQPRFPADFAFRLTPRERAKVVAICDHLSGNLKYSKTLPLAFTEHGALMAATVLNTPKAIAMSLYVIRAFLQLRRLIEKHAELHQRLSGLERKVEQHDGEIVSLARSLRQLSAPDPVPRRRRIGFSRDRD